MKYEYLLRHFKIPISLITETKRKKWKKGNSNYISISNNNIKRDFQIYISSKEKDLKKFSKYFWLFINNNKIK